MWETHYEQGVNDYQIWKKEKIVTQPDLYQ